MKRSWFAGPQVWSGIQGPFLLSAKMCLRSPSLPDFQKLYPSHVFVASPNLLEFSVQSSGVRV